MNAISRRKFFTSSIKAAAAIGAAPLALEETGSCAAGQRPAGQPPNPQSYLDAIDKAIAFQNAMMDAYASGLTVRLVQSYSDQSGLLSTAFT